jgi:hypothetical protein
MEMRQPQSTITTGVRQPIVATREAGATEIVMTANLFDAENDLRSSRTTDRDESSVVSGATRAAP